MWGGSPTESVKLSSSGQSSSNRLLRINYMNRKEAIKKWEEIINEVTSKKQELDSIFSTIKQEAEKF